CAMASALTRRDFVQQAVGTGALTALAGWSFLDRLPRVSADQVHLAHASVRFSNDIEPLVRLLEDTHRENIVPIVAERIHGGTSYQEFMTALLLAGVRGIQPRPVGFKFHAVLVLHSAHLASLAATDRDRW